jgi:iron uptake system EfeUOB component EfeO/EfeM
LTEALAKIKPTESLRLTKEAARRKRKWSDFSDNSSVNRQVEELSVTNLTQSMQEKQAQWILFITRDKSRPKEYETLNSMKHYENYETYYWDIKGGMDGGSFTTSHRTTIDQGNRVTRVYEDVWNKHRGWQKNHLQTGQITI